MSRYKTFELNCEDVLNEIIGATSKDWVLEQMFDSEELMSMFTARQLLKHFGEDDVLSEISDDALAEEYVRRSPLGRALE